MATYVVKFQAGILLLKPDVQVSIYLYTVILQLSSTLMVIVADAAASSFLFSSDMKWTFDLLFLQL